MELEQQRLFFKLGPLTRKPDEAQRRQVGAYYSCGAKSLRRLSSTWNIKAPWRRASCFQESMGMELALERWCNRSHCSTYWGGGEEKSRLKNRKFSEEKPTQLRVTTLKTQTRCACVWKASTKSRETRTNVTTAWLTISKVLCTFTVQASTALNGKRSSWATPPLPVRRVSTSSSTQLVIIGIFLLLLVAHCPTHARTHATNGFTVC